MSFKCFFNSHFVFVSQIHISFLQGSSFRFAVIIGEYKRRIGKLVLDSYQALVEAVKIWNNEEKRLKVCRYIKETAGQYPNHRGMKKKLMDLMPETPFEGEPMAVTREPNDMEKSLL